jgi:hypothetical protein
MRILPAVPRLERARRTKESHGPDALMRAGRVSRRRLGGAESSSVSIPLLESGQPDQASAEDSGSLDRSRRRSSAPGVKSGKQALRAPNELRALGVWS